MPESPSLPIIALLCANAIALVAVALVLARVLRRRLHAARRSAAEDARNAEIAAMTQGLAHEIKNPLSTVGLNAQLLREEILDAPLGEAERDRMVRRVDALAREATRLSDVLNDFLRYAGRLQLDTRDVDLRLVVQELADFFAPQAEQAGVALRVDLPAAPVHARVDASLLKQVLLNLMLNGVQAMQRHHAGGARTLVLAVRGDDPRDRRGTPHATLTVQDNGPGVPPDLREQIFQPYVTTRPGGNGLGLATARRIIEAHGGRIEVQAATIGAGGTSGGAGGAGGSGGAAAGSPTNAAAPGARFIVTLPTEGPPEAAATPTSPSA